MKKIYDSYTCYFVFQKGFLKILLFLCDFNYPYIIV